MHTLRTSLSCLLLLCVVGLASAKTHTLAGAENAYLVMDGSRDDYYTRDGLVWDGNPLDAGAGNDVLNGDGSFEGTWDGTAGGCAVGCPHNMTCNCDDAANATQVSNFVYDGDQCLGMIPGGYEAVDAGWWDFSTAGSYLNYPVDSLGNWTLELGPYAKTFTAVALIEIPSIGTYTNGQGIVGQESNSADPDRLDNWALSLGVGAGKSLRARLGNKSDPQEYVDLTTIESNPVIQTGVKTLVAFRFQYEAAGSCVLNVSRMDNRGFVEKQITNANRANSDRNYWIAGNTDIGANFGNLGGKMYWLAMYAGTYGTTGVSPVSDSDLQALYNKTKKPNELTDRLIFYTDFHQAAGAAGTKYTPEISFPVPNGVDYTSTRRPHVYEVAGSPTHGGSSSQTVAASPHSSYWRTCVSACTGGSSYIRAETPSTVRTNFVPAGDFTFMALMRRQVANDAGLYTTMFENTKKDGSEIVKDASIKILIGGFYGGTSNRVLSSISSNGTNDCNGGGSCPNWYGGLTLTDDEVFLLAFVYDYSGTPGTTSSFYQRIVERNRSSTDSQVGNQPGPIHVPDDENLITTVCGGTSTDTNSGYCYWAGAWNRTFSQAEVEGLFRQTTHPVNDYSTDLIEFWDFHQAVGATYTGDYAGMEFDVTGTPVRYGNDGSVVSLPPGNSYVAADGLSFPANSAYQIQFSQYGTLGTEKSKLVVEETDSGDQYDFSAKTWGGAAYKETAVGTLGTWSTVTAQVVTGVAARTPVKVILKAAGTGGPILFDRFIVTPLRQSGPKAGATNLVVEGGVKFTDSPDGMTRGSGSAPAYKWGTWFDGTSGKLTCSVANCPWSDPADDFSFGCYKMVPENSAAPIAGNSAGAVGWGFYTSVAKHTATIINAAHLSTTVTMGATTSVAGSPSNALFTYDYKADTTSVLNVYSNTNTPGNSSTARGPATGGGDMSIGYVPGHSYFTGSMGRCAAWNRALSATEAYQWMHPYFPSNNFGIENSVRFCGYNAQAICTKERCVNGRTTWCPAEGSGVVSIAEGRTEYAANNSFETNTGSDAVPIFTGWSIGGTGSRTAYKVGARHGNVAYRGKTSGVQTETLESSCAAVTPTTTLTSYLYAKALSGSPKITYKLRLYTDGACGVYHGASTLHSKRSDGVIENTDLDAILIPTRWNLFHGTLPSLPPGINSARIYIMLSGDGDTLLDTVSLRANTENMTPWVLNSGVGTTTFTSRHVYLDNPLAKTVNGGLAYTQGYCVGGWVWDSHEACHDNYLWYTTTTGLANTTALQTNNADCSPQFSILDKDGKTGLRRPTGSTVSDTVWTSNNWKYIEGCVLGSTLQAHHYNAATQTWHAWNSTVGSTAGFSGVQNAQSTSLHLGSTGGGYTIDGYAWRPFVAPFDGTNYSNTMFYKPGTTTVDLPPRPF